MKANTSKIAVLLATYNGENYIREQLNSLFSQTFSDWILYIRDDQSTDSTLSIIYEYQKHSDKIILLENDGENLGAKDNFLRLLSVVDSRYYMFMDEDDVWLPNKIEESFNVMIKAEDGSNNIPVLVHTNLKVVDKDLTVITESFWDSIHFEPRKFHNSHYLSMMGYITGSTMLFNRKAKDVAFPVDPNAVMHDWWIGISVYRYGGKVISVKTPLMLYRKHGNNVTGDFVANSAGKRLLTRLNENILVYKMLRDCKCMDSIWQFLLYKLLVVLKRRF